MKWTAVVVAALAIPVVTVAVVQPDRQVTVDRTDLKWSGTGRTLGWLGRGARVEAIGGQGGYTRARVRGWARADALVERGDGLAVGRPETPLTAEPAGAAIGGLVQGVEVRRTGTEGDWYEIELIGWLDSEALGPLVEEEPADAAAPDTVAPSPAVAAARPATATATAATDVARLSARSGLRAVPEGPVLADLPEGMAVVAGETRGGWTRVVVEGWVPRGSIQAGAEGDLSPEVVALGAADAFVGRPVTWTLEHVAVQEADEWRSDFRPGETFELARVPGATGRYVYLALPSGMAGSFRDLAPFEQIRVSGTIRTGRSELTGNPIVDVTRVHP